MQYQVIPVAFGILYKLIFCSFFFCFFFFVFWFCADADTFFFLLACYGFIVAYQYAHINIKSVKVAIGIC